MDGKMKPFEPRTYSLIPNFRTNEINKRLTEHSIMFAYTRLILLFGSWERHNVNENTQETIERRTKRKYSEWKIKKNQPPDRIYIVYGIRYQSGNSKIESHTNHTNHI